LLVYEQHKPKCLIQDIQLLKHGSEHMANDCI